MNIHRTFPLFPLILVLLSACGGSSDESSINEQDLLMTYSVGTMVSGFFETQTALVTPTPANTNTPVITNTFPPPPTIANTPTFPATWTPVPVFYTAIPNIALTPSVTGTPPTATQNTGALGFGCNNLAIVREVNYPNGSTIKAGEDFIKTWKVQNTGSCEWEYNYSLVLVNDEFFKSQWGRLGRNVSPGNWAEISVQLSAPKRDGTFSASWRLADAGGNAFGATLTLTLTVVE